MLLEVSRLTKTYRAGEGSEELSVLHDLSLEAQAGESVAIIGPSGSGKSTILNIIGALDRADAGSVRVDGQKVETLSEEEAAAYRRTKVGFVFQLHHLLPQCTVLENVLAPTLAVKDRDTGALQERARALLGSVGLTHRLEHRPGQLSGGERQRAAVARALINRPRLLLADEPTGALDRASAEQLMELLSEVVAKEGVTLLMVTHALDLARRLQRILELRDGRLAPVEP